MNSFFEHHKDSIRWHYRCFDRILLNGLIQPFQQPERVVGFFNTYRRLYPVTRYTLRDIADQFQRWVKERAAKRNIPIVEAPAGRRDEFVDPYFERAKPDAVVVILKAREPARGLSNSASAGQRLRKKRQALVHPVINAGMVVGELLVAMPDPKLIQPSHEPAGACAAARHE